ncbi:9852_t:CDS:2 [Acaulospora morrowiae]|uniref:9852_t:CDS:1 n=1 Tax=Acaulospora morrowiae TaxID=94023 RepID=A0A9N9FZ11_9GLOM|nr:9852_t:CDS:2 [Acaulospora morrowiae]
MLKSQSSLSRRNLLFFGKCPSCNKVNTSYNHCTQCSNWIKTTASTLSTLDTYDPSYREILSELEQKRKTLKESICKKCEQAMHMHKRLMGCVECGAPQKDLEELQKMAVQVKGRIHVMDIDKIMNKETLNAENDELPKCEICETNSNTYWAMCPRYYPIDEILAEEVIKVQPNDPDFRKINDILLHAENIAKVSKRLRQKEQEAQQAEIKRQEEEMMLQEELHQQELQRALQREKLEEQKQHYQYELSYQHQFEILERQQSHQQYQPQFNDYELPSKKDDQPYGYVHTQSHKQNFSSSESNLPLLNPEPQLAQYDQTEARWNQPADRTYDSQQSEQQPNIQEMRNLQVNQLYAYDANDRSLRASVNSVNSNTSSNGKSNIFDDDCDYQTVLRFNS